MTSYSTLAVLPGVPLDLPVVERATVEVSQAVPVTAPQPVALAPTPAPTPAPAPIRVMPPAGWYVDPSGRHGQRYWDGSAWTEHTT